MTDFLAFLAALNWQFVVLCLVLFGGLNVLFIIFSIAHADKRREKIRHEEQMEQKRIDAARSIVPVRPRSGED